MPGVPPDALAQVKRGFRGLFGRKKKNQVQPNPAPNDSSSSAVASNPEATKSSVSPVTKADSNPPAPQPATTSSPQKAEPSAQESSDRTPALPTPSEPQVQPSTEATKNTDPSVTIPTSTDKPTSTSAVGNNGMSATSGPLDDQMVHEYSDIGKEDVDAPVSKEEAAIAGKEEITAAKPVNVDAVQT